MNKISFVIKLLVIVIFIGCARYEALTGGEEDKIAPTITNSDPKSDTTKIGDMNRFYFEFSEMVNRKSFEDHFYIQPFLKYRPRFEWSGWSELEVFIKDTLKNDITYQMVVGKGFTDLHNVASESEFRIAFSKSDVLDSLAFSGSLKTDKIKKKIRLALYKRLNLNDFPSYIGDISKSNQFNLSNLKPANYIPIFFEDKNNNFKIDLASEELFIAYNTIQLDSNLNLNFQGLFHKTDTIKPVLSNIDTIENGLVLVKSLSKIDFKNSDVFFIDTIGKKIEIVQMLEKSDKEIYLFFNDDTEHYPLKLNYTRLVDNIGNMNDSVHINLEFEKSTANDTNRFQINSVSPSDSSYFKSIRPEITVSFSKTISLSNIDLNAFQLKTSKNQNISLEVDQTSLTSLRLKPKEELSHSMNYVFEINSKLIKSWSNESLADSIYHYRYYGLSKNKFGWIKFKLIANKKDNIILKLFRIDGNQKKLYKEEKLKTGNVIVENILGGQYLMDFYYDENKNNEYDFGKIKPLSFPEKYFFSTDTVSVRANWENDKETIRLENFVP